MFYLSTHFSIIFISLPFFLSLSIMFYLFTPFFLQLSILFYLSLSIMFFSHFLSCFISLPLSFYHVLSLYSGLSLNLYHVLYISLFFLTIMLYLSTHFSLSFLFWIYDLIMCYVLIIISTLYVYCEVCLVMWWYWLNLVYT